jgi:hypothetical protein
MSEVPLHRPFRNTEHPRQLIGGHQGASQETDNALPRGSFGRQHGTMVKTDPWKSQTAGTVEFRHSI